MNEKRCKAQKFLKHELFNRAAINFEVARMRQIEKAWEKYDEPLNPDSWTSKQLHKHAMEELVDLTHYLTAMLEKAEKMEKLMRDVRAHAVGALELDDAHHMRVALNAIVRSIDKEIGAE